MEKETDKMSQTLRDARKYEELSETRIRPEDRPAFHLTARTGWMNDPNGFSYYQGEYHLFYQYHPYETKWGPMFWGHAVSSDLLHWRYRPAALAPDEAYDRGGCFSGSALELPDGRQLLMYTGVAETCQEDGGPQAQTQCIAVGDGLDYEKALTNPVIGSADLPEGCSRYDFRDPKLWRRSDGSYACVIGSCTEDKDGQILLYSSRDGFRWEYETTLAKNNGRFGKMWECPDFFELDGSWVLLTSPQDMLPQGMEYINGNGTLCLTGDFEEKTGQFTERTDQAVDHGIDFYAPQTVLTPDGRRIMIGWMQNWDTCRLEKTEMPWFGQMSLPRELSIRNGRLIQQPVRELEQLRTGRVAYHGVSDSGMKVLGVIRGGQLDLEVTLYPEEGGARCQRFVLCFAQNSQYRTSLEFCPASSVLQLDRSFSGSRRAVIHQRRIQVTSKNGAIKLRLILDRFSAEVFVNDGEQVMTAVIYTEQEADGISFFADGEVRMDVVQYELQGDGTASE